MGRQRVLTAGEISREMREDDAPESRNAWSNAMCAQTVPGSNPAGAMRSAGQDNIAHS
jgi:hypothetical protein